MYVLFSSCNSETWYDRRTLWLWVKKRFYILLDTSWTIGSTKTNNVSYESFYEPERQKRGIFKEAPRPLPVKSNFLVKCCILWKWSRDFIFFSQHPGRILIRKIYIRSHGDFFDLFCYFSGTVDGFFRILEKTSSKLICTQLHFFSWGYVYFQL